MNRLSMQNARLKRQRVRPGREPARHVHGRHRQHKIKPRPVEAAEPTYYGDEYYGEEYAYSYENEAEPKPLRPRRPHKEFTYRKPGGKQRVRQTNTISNPPSANQDDSYYYSQVGRR